MLYCLSFSHHVVAVVAVIQSSVGEWLSLVEHLVRDQGVGGSNPLSPTNLFKGLQGPEERTWFRPSCSSAATRMDTECFRPEGAPLHLQKGLQPSGQLQWGMLKPRRNLLKVLRELLPSFRKVS